jgi:hypothetical protein
VHMADGGGWCLFFMGRCSIVLRRLTLALSFVCLICLPGRAADVDLLSIVRLRAKACGTRSSIRKLLFGSGPAQSTGIPSRSGSGLSPPPSFPDARRSP